MNKKKLHFSRRALANVTVEYIYFFSFVNAFIYALGPRCTLLNRAIVAVVYLLCTFFHADFLTTLTEWPHYVLQLSFLLGHLCTVRSFSGLAQHTRRAWAFCCCCCYLCSLLFVCIFANFAANFIYCCKTAFFFFVVVVAAAVTSHILFIYVNCYCVST